MRWRPKPKSNGVLMHCAKCGHQNPVGTKFCGQCGTRLRLVWAAGGTVNPVDNRFCGECRSLLSETAATESARSRLASPQACTPRHMAEQILSSRSAFGRRVLASHRSVCRSAGFDGAPRRGDLRGPKEQPGRRRSVSGRRRVDAAGRRAAGVVRGESGPARTRVARVPRRLTFSRHAGDPLSEGR